MPWSPPGQCFTIVGCRCSEKVAELAADTLRAGALDEELKRRVMSAPALAGLAAAVASRYSGGETVDDAIAAARAGLAWGHQASIDYAGESVRDAALAWRATNVFVALAIAIGQAGIPSTVSLDLPHVGSVVDRDLGYRHARKIAEASTSLGTAMMISAEGSDRTDLVLDLYEALAAEYRHVGITLQARLHRTPEDLERVPALPGTVRLVKGSFLETDHVAWQRGSPECERAGLVSGGIQDQPRGGCCRGCPVDGTKRTVQPPTRNCAASDAPAAGASR